jgi:endonuclease-3
MPKPVPRLLALLRGAYGPRPPKCWGDGVGVLVDTILSQNTSAANSDAGYRKLRRRFRSWKQVAEAPAEEVERCIRVSGLSNLKAPRIQAILRKIKSDRGKIDLQFLNDLDDEAAYDYLRAFPGVGPKTACCTLLFAFGKALFPVDTHIHRIARRLGLAGPKATAEQTRDALTPMIDPGDRYEAHVLLIEHGRKTCRAINPRCDECVLLGHCAFGRQRVRRGVPRAAGNDRGRPGPITKVIRRR